jgi:hypothetical protein
MGPADPFCGGEVRGETCRNVVDLGNFLPQDGVKLP